MATYQPFEPEQTPYETTGDGGRTAAARAEERRRAEEARSIGGLFRELTEETSAFVQAEIALARRETAEKLEMAQRGAKQLVTGAVVLGLGLWALTAALIYGLATELPLWASALIVGALVLTVGGIFLAMAKRNMASRKLEPERTVRSLKATRNMAEEHLR